MQLKDDMKNKIEAILDWKFHRNKPSNTNIFSSQNSHEHE